MSAGKGDRNRTADLNAYRSSPLWDNLFKENNSYSEFSDKLNTFEEYHSFESSNNKYLLLDDIREIENCYVGDKKLTIISGIPKHKWDIVRSYDEFVDYVKLINTPLTISFDFDLDSDETNRFTDWRDSKIKTGAHCAEWLINHCITYEKKLPVYYIHSTNTNGRTFIDNILRKFIKN